MSVEVRIEAFESSVRVAPGVSLEVRGVGEGTPVLLLPDFGCDLSSFARQARAIGRRYGALAINPRGVGLSDWKDPQTSGVPSLASDADVLLGAWGHVVGAGLGASAALELALTHPQRVRSLCLITPLVRARPRLLAVLDSWCAISAATVEALPHFLMPWLFSQTLLADTVRRERAFQSLDAAARRIPCEVLCAQAAGLREWDGKREAELGNIRVPTLVIAAGDDLLTPDGAEIATLIPGARLIVIQGAGHAVTLEAGEEVSSSLIEHLQSTDATR